MAADYWASVCVPASPEMLASGARGLLSALFFRLLSPQPLTSFQVNQKLATMTTEPPVSQQVRAWPPLFSRQLD